MKRGVSVLVVILLLLNSVWAEPSVTLAPLSAYETNDVNFALNISHLGSPFAITGVLLNLPGFSVRNLADYAGWMESKNGSLAAWSGGILSNNVFLATFEVLAQAPNVNSDSTHEATLRLVDSASVEHAYSFQVKLLNDPTGPVVSGLVPSDGSFAREGTSDYVVSANISDEETGVEGVTFHYVRCNFTGNLTPQDRTLDLGLKSGLYTGNIDLSSYGNGQVLCFDYLATSEGGESTSYSGRLTVDGAAPSVTLVSPVHNTVIGTKKNFSFFADDNFSPNMTCSMNIDGSEYLSGIVAADMDVVFISSADVAEGNHNWSMTCKDLAGLSATSDVWTYTLDKSAPVITMSVPNGSLISGSSAVDVVVSDNNELGKVYLTVGGSESEVESEFSLDVTSWPEGENTFQIRARDAVGNEVNSQYVLIVDKSGPVVNLISPAANGTSDVHVAFTYTALDTFDSTPTCKLVVDSANYEDIDSNGTVVLEKILLLGDHEWNVQCVDDAGNSGKSVVRQFSVVDTSGPDIAVNNPDVVFRGNPIAIDLGVTDVSGVDEVRASLTDPLGNTQDLPLERLGDSYTAAVDTTAASALGAYALAVYAVDTLNNSNTGNDEILLTYKYVISLELPASVPLGAGVSMAGHVAMDDGGVVPEDSITLVLPGNVTANVSVVGGNFSHTFNAPTVAGTYSVSAGMVSAGNSQLYTAEKSFSVYQPQVGGNGGGSGGGSGSSSSGNGCNSDWTCTAWTSCSLGKQTRTCVDGNKCNIDSSKVESRSCTATDSAVVKTMTAAAGETEEDDEDVHYYNGTSSYVETKELPQSGSALGIGKASGFMNLGSLSWSNILLAVLLMAIIMGALAGLGWGKRDSRKKPVASDFLSNRGDSNRGRNKDLESYLAGRAGKDRF